MSVETGTSERRGLLRGPRHVGVPAVTGPTSTPPSDARDTDFTTLTPPANGRASAKANGTITGDHGINGSNGNGNNGNGNGGSNPSSTGTPPATTASAAAPSSHDPAAGTTSRPATSDAPMPRPRRYRIETGWASLTKRTIDLAVAIPLMAVTVVAFPWIALAIKITSRGPVLFRQVRIGRGGEPIVVYKFRSMHIDAEARLRRDEALYREYIANGFKVPAESDPRITAVGRFLRSSSLDELPQALCLLRGTMSVVGPRPVVPDELRELYGDEPGPYLACKPGITGLWQTSGRSTVVHGKRARLDAQYATDWSLLLDIKILVRTIPAVLSAHGAH